MLIRCPECGHDVSDKAATCPNCGIQIAGYITHPDGMSQPNGASGSSVANANKSVKDGKRNPEARENGYFCSYRSSSRWDCVG